MKPIACASNNGGTQIAYIALAITNRRTRTACWASLPAGKSGTGAGRLRAVVREFMAMKEAAPRGAL